MEKYINRCYNSLSIQKDADDVEFIFVNDGSCDGTLSILQDIESKDKRVVIINQVNSGVSAARNAALKIARGEFVYLLDGDDYLTDNALSDFKRILKNYNPDLLISAYNVSRNNTEIFRPLPFSEGIYKIKDFFASISHFPTTPQLVYRTEIIKNNNIQFESSIKCGEVYAFTINYIRFIDKIYVLNKPTFNYFQRNESAIHKCNYDNDITVINALSSIYKDGKEFTDYSSFHITAFKLMCAFSYNKYLKYAIDSNTLKTIEYVLSSDVANKCLERVLFKQHKFMRERLQALYMWLMPKRLGFKIINKFVKKRI